MKIKKHNFLYMVHFLKYTFIFLLFIFSNGFAQNNVIENSTSIDVGLSENSKDSKVETIINTLGVGTPVIFKMQQIISVEKSTEGYLVAVQFKNIQFKNDVFYKNFSLINYLVPANIFFDIEIIENGSKILLEKKTYSTDLIRENSKVSVIKIPGTAEINIEDVIINNIGFEYSERHIKKFTERCRLIDEYYNFSSNIKLEMTKIKDLNTTNIDQLEAYKKQINNTEEFIKNVKSRGFSSKLNLNLADPANFVKDLNELTEKTKKLKNEINFALANMYITYYKKAIILLDKKDTSRAKLTLYKSQKEKENFYPTQISLSQILVNENNIDSSYFFLVKAYNNNQINPDEKEACLTIAKTISAYFKNTASSYIKSKDYGNAIKYLYASSNLCSNISKTLCNEELYNMYTTTHTGIFNAIIDSIEYRINASDFEGSEKFIDSAVNYKNLNNYYITTKDKLIPLINKEFEYLMNTANTNLENDAYYQSEALYTMADRLCKKYTLIQCSDNIYEGLKMSHQGIYDSKTDSLEALVKQGKYEDASKLINTLKVYQLNYKLVLNPEIIRYEKFINEKYYQQNVKQAQLLIFDLKFKMAIDLLAESKKLQLKYNFDPHPKFDSLYSQAAQGAVLTEFKLGKRRAAENNIPEAKRHYSIAISYIEKYKIMTSETVESEKKELNDLIFSQNCKKAQLDYDIQVNTAKKFMNDKKYIDANNAFVKAIRISDEYSDCQILTSDALAEREKIIDIVNFQQRIIQINSLIIDKSYEDAISAYKKLEKFYEDSNIYRQSGIKMMPLDTFLLSSNNDFINYAVKYFANNNELEKSFHFLNVLKEKQMPSKWTEINQNLLGNKLAIRDSKTEKIDTPKTFVLNYTSGDKWFKFLQKAYLKQMKLLKIGK